MRSPDPRKHLATSLVKSFIRIVAYGALSHVAPVAAGMLFLAEVLGIYEEIA